MSAYDYDEAVIERFRSMFNKSNIHIVPPDRVFNIISRINEDEIKLPIISLKRSGFAIGTQKQNHMMKFDGTLLLYDEEKNKNVRLQAIPILISYQVDIWTKHRQENDNILAELIFYLATHPTLDVKVLYGDIDYCHKFNLFLDNDVEDNSDIVNHVNKGEYFRQTLNIYTDDAYLWKSSSRKPTTVDAQLIEKETGKEL